MRKFYKVSLYTGETSKPIVKRTPSLAMAREWVSRYEHGVIEYQGRWVKSVADE